MSIGGVIGGVAGTAVGGPGGGSAVGYSIGNFIESLFGGKNQSNNTFVDSIVSSTQAAGFKGFTHDDVVHLLPGNWSNDHQGAINQIQAYLNIGMAQPEGTNLTSYFDFGGGYYPNHAIYYYPSSTVSPGSPGVLPIVTTSTNNGNIIWIILILIVLIVIFKKK